MRCPKQKQGSVFICREDGFDAKVLFMMCFNLVLALDTQTWSFCCCFRLWNCSDSTRILQFQYSSGKCEMYIKGQCVSFRAEEQEFHSSCRISEGEWTSVTIQYNANLRIMINEDNYQIDKSFSELKSFQIGSDSVTMDVLSINVQEHPIIFS